MELAGRTADWSGWRVELAGRTGGWSDWRLELARRTWEWSGLREGQAGRTQKVSQGGVGRRHLLDFWRPGPGWRKSLEPLQGCLAA